MVEKNPSLQDFQWSPQPAAATFVAELVAGCRASSSAVRMLEERLREQAGGRLGDWIDHFVIAADDPMRERLSGEGYRPAEAPETWRIESGLFPPVRIGAAGTRQLVLRVESVTDFLLANGCADGREVEGSPMAPIRRARIDREGETELWALERHGSNDLTGVSETADGNAAAFLAHRDAFRRRPRRFHEPASGFAAAMDLVERSSADLGIDRTCDLFFVAEREYWQSRNRAARVQKNRQDALGLGWANHDHHTYRSSREHFRDLIRVLERLGFYCRERFYAGREAGWGAQVLEHPRAGIVIFADVDLSPEEVTGDFSHEPLAFRPALGTVGLWCALHGEAFLQAGMHHLECQFDFDAARSQLAACGIESMKPFTDLPWLRQAFTRGEFWPVAEDRIASLLGGGMITPDQAATFRTRGALGSHLEILQRDDGYKGFNQTGINEIIRDTDPRGPSHARTATSG